VAKVEGPQEIPSELLDGYRAAMGEITPIDGVRKRYPYRVPTMQTVGGHPTPKQKERRTWFKNAITRFRALSPAEKTRWYDAMPAWGSLLWYYNYFMMSGIDDLDDGQRGGAKMLKQIISKKDNIPIGGKTVTHGGTVDPTKCVVMIWGASHQTDFEEVSENFGYSWSWIIYPIWSNLTATEIRIDWGTAAEVAGDVVIQIIEYI